MHPKLHAQTAPDRAAYIMVETGEVVTYKQLDERSNQGAQLFRKHGLVRGDSILLFLENNARFLELCWAAQRSGLYYTPISYRLTAAEIEYIVGDLKPKMFFTSEKLVETARTVSALQSGTCRNYLVDGRAEDYLSYVEERDARPTTPIADESFGTDLLYSSGSTGRPKGVKIPLPGGPIDNLEPRWRAYHTIMGFDWDSVHYIPSPLYHALPIHHAMVAQHYGGTVLVIQKFDPEEALRLIERYKVSQSSWVATMFIRMLKLPEAVRRKYDVSSMIGMVHGAGPCPIPVKEAMIEWFGEIIHETYSSTEGFGAATINSTEWLQHKGSVGRSMLSPAHIVDDETGAELPAGEIGTIYFEAPRKVEYLNDAAKTSSVHHPKGWATAGDIGYLDADGYLYLTDRKADMIISGGVNIYPQEIEAVLILHPKIADIAVFGIPNEDFGEEVKAVVAPTNFADAGPALEAEIIDYCKSQLAALKAPKTVDFLPELPRHETGKLYKRLLRDPYWAGKGKNIN